MNRKSNILFIIAYTLIAILIVISLYLLLGGNL